MEAVSFGVELPRAAAVVISIVAITYFLFILGFGAYFSRFSKDINDFFFSGQRFAWWLVAASMIATGIGSHSYLKYAQQGYETGMSSTMTYMNNWFLVAYFVFGWLPIIYFSRIRSIPQYFERRFNRMARYLAVIILLSYMFFYIGLSFYTVGVAVEGLFGIPHLYSVPVLALVLGVYVTFGGQTAVIFTDLLQGFMLYAAGAVCIIAGFWALGGFGEFWGWLPESHRLPFVRMLETPGYNAAGLFWGEALAGSIMFTFLNQGWIMRYLACRSVHEGRKAAFFNFLITLPLSAIVVGAVGWIGKSIIVKQAAVGGSLEGIDPIYIQNTAHTFVIVAWEVLRHNPWAFGFVIAALSAALMSTIDTLINACAAVGIYDVYRPMRERLHPNTPDRHYLVAARWASAISTILGVLLVIWFVKQRSTIMAMHYRGIMLIVPPLVTTLFLGCFWRRFNAAGAVVALAVGVFFTYLTAVRPEVLRPLIWLVIGVDETGYPVGRGWEDAAGRINPLSNLYMNALYGMLITGLAGVAATHFSYSRYYRPLIQRSAAGLAKLPFRWAPMVAGFMVESLDKHKDITGLTVDTVTEGMARFKGGVPNHTRGKKATRVPVEFDPAIPFKQVSVSPALMDRLKANEGDMVYVADSRWWLGGLRSVHTYAAKPHALGRDVARMSKETYDDALMIEGRPVMLEKIL
jgi:solute:Na+ symporter, SSS family